MSTEDDKELRERLQKEAAEDEALPTPIYGAQFIPPDQVEEWRRQGKPSPLSGKVTVIANSRGVVLRDVLCDGCNVREPHEHRCHEHLPYVGGERVMGAKCSCPDCHPSEEELAAFRAELEQRNIDKDD